RPSGGTGIAGLEPHLEYQLRRIRQRRSMIERCPTASNAQDRCPVCSYFAVLQELSERQTTVIASASPSRSIVQLTDCQPVQHQTEVVGRVGQEVFWMDSPLLMFEIVAGPLLGLQQNY